MACPVGKFAMFTSSDIDRHQTAANAIDKNESPMMRQGVPLGRVLGIPIRLDYSWFLMLALLTWMLATSYFPAEFGGWPLSVYWLMGALTALAFFASLLLHELGHSVVALRYKVPVRSITLFIFGGVAQIGGEPPSAKAEFRIAIAGPIVSLALALAFYALKPLLGGLPPVYGMAQYLAFMNLAVALFNLIPGYPLDGGRVLRAIVWATTRNLQRATVIAGTVGRGFGLLFILVGVWQVLGGNLGGLWLAFIGWFLESAASAQILQTTVQNLLAGHRVSQAMGARCPVVAEDLTLQRLVDEHVLGRGERCFLVNRGERTVGLVTVHRVKAVPRADWGTATVGQVMLPLEESRRVEPDAALSVALQLMDRDGVNQLPVMSGARVLGMLSREDVISYLRTLQDLQALG